MGVLCHLSSILRGFYFHVKGNDLMDSAHTVAKIPPWRHQGAPAALRSPARGAAPRRPRRGPGGNVRVRERQSVVHAKVTVGLGLGAPRLREPGGDVRVRERQRVVQAPEAHAQPQQRRRVRGAARHAAARPAALPPRRAHRACARRPACLRGRAEPALGITQGAHALLRACCYARRPTCGPVRPALDTGQQCRLDARPCTAQGAAAAAQPFLRRPAASPRGSTLGQARWRLSRNQGIRV